MMTDTIDDIVERFIRFVDGKEESLSQETLDEVARIMRECGRNCDVCGQWYHKRRAGSMYCSQKCTQKSYRQRRAESVK